MPDENYSHDVENAEIAAGLREPGNLGVPLSDSTEDGSGYDHLVKGDPYAEVRSRVLTTSDTPLGRKSKLALIVGGILCVGSLGLNIANHLWFNPTRHYEVKVNDSIFFSRARGLFGYEAFTKNLVFEGENLNTMQISSKIFGTKFGVKRYYYDSSYNINSIENWVYDKETKRLIFDRNSRVLTPYNDTEWHNRRKFNLANKKLIELRTAYSNHMNKHHTRY